jgi:hypothetical protein
MRHEGPWSLASPKACGVDLGTLGRSEWNCDSGLCILWLTCVWPL